MNLTEYEAQKLNGENIPELIGYFKKQRESKVKALVKSVDEKESDKIRGAIEVLDFLIGLDAAIKNPLKT